MLPQGFQIMAGADLAANVRAKRKDDLRNFVQGGNLVFSRSTSPGSSYFMIFFFRLLEFNVSCLGFILAILDEYDKGRRNTDA